jgi:hypothetical protein
MRRRSQRDSEPSVDDAKPRSVESATPAPSAPAAQLSNLSTRNKLLMCGLVVVIQCGTDLLLEGVKVALVPRMRTVALCRLAMVRPRSAGSGSRWAEGHPIHKEHDQHHDRSSEARDHKRDPAGTDRTVRNPSAVARDHGSPVAENGSTCNRLLCTGPRPALSSCRSPARCRVVLRTAHGLSITVLRISLYCARRQCSPTARCTKRTICYRTICCILLTTT